MDELRAAELISALPGEVILWRGEHLDGSDVDVVVADERLPELSARLSAAGLVPAPQEWGRVLWRALPDEAVVVDVLAESAWPRMYPPVELLRARAQRGRLGQLVAAPADRRRVFAAERLAGRSGRSASVPLAPPQILAALRVRFLSDPLPPRVRGHDGQLIALSGMDGAGKSTAALRRRDELAAAGTPAVVHWTRFAADVGRLDLLARAVRWVLRRKPAADVEGEDEKPSAPGIVDRVWVLLVAATTVRTARRAARLRRRGYTVVCDRWLLDALVDLRVRHGRHPAAERVLRRGFPRADETTRLRVDPAVAAVRKPGDQSAAVLAAQAAEYERVAAELDSGGRRASSRDLLRAAVPKPLRSALWWTAGRLEVAQQRLFEARLGVRTSGHAYADDSGAVGDSAFYEGCQWLPLRRVLAELDAGPQDVFVDLGAGKGQALLVAATRQLDRVIGVDLMPDLSDAARRNLEAARPRLRCREYEVVTADATRWHLPDDVTIVFMYCPFFGAVFDAAMGQVFASFDRRPRPLRILYAFPWEHNRLLATERVVVEAVHPAQWPARPWWWRTGWTIVSYRVLESGAVPVATPGLRRRLFRPARAVARWSAPNDQRFRLFRPDHGFVKDSRSSAGDGLAHGDAQQAGVFRPQPTFDQRESRAVGEQPEAERA